MSDLLVSSFLLSFEPRGSLHRPCPQIKKCSKSCKRMPSWSHSLKCWWQGEEGRCHPPIINQICLPLFLSLPAPKCWGKKLLCVKVLWVIPSRNCSNGTRLWLEQMWIPFWPGIQIQFPERANQLKQDQWPPLWTALALPRSRDLLEPSARARRRNGGSADFGVRAGDPGEIDVVRPGVANLRRPEEAWSMYIWSMYIELYWLPKHV